MGSLGKIFGHGGWRAIAARLAVLSLVLQLFVPMLHGAANAAAGQGSIVICTPDGYKAVTPTSLAADQSERGQSSPEEQRLGPQCPACLAMQASLALPAAEPAVFTPTLLAVPFSVAASDDYRRTGLGQFRPATRAPPTSV